MDHKSTSSKKVVGLALQVNREPGAKMLESTCECGVVGELGADGFKYQRQAKMPAGAKPKKIAQNYRVDFVINGKMIVELKGISGE